MTNLIYSFHYQVINSKFFSTSPHFFSKVLFNKANLQQASYKHFPVKFTSKIPSFLSHLLGSNWTVSDNNDVEERFKS